MGLQRIIPAVVAVTLFMAFFGLGSVTLFDVDEAVFAQATKEMTENNNWLTPTYNGINRYDKPILFYWLMAGSYKAFGINEFSARLPSATAACILVLSLFFFAKQTQGDKFALYTVVIFVLSLYFLVYSHASVTDMTLSLFISLALFSFYLYQENSEKRFFIYGFYFFSALAFLTKGLIGIVFPFGVASAYMFFIRKWSGIGKVFNLKGIMIFLVVAAPWYIAQLVVNGQEFVDQFIIKHHFKRYLDVISGHKGPFYYYIPVLLAGLFPWSIFLPMGISNAVKTKDRFFLYALIWFAFVFIFFSLSTTKLPNYILPAVPAAAMLIASAMSRQADNMKSWWKYSSLILALLMLLMAAAFMLSKPYMLKYAIYDINWVYMPAALLMSMGLLFLYSAFSRKSFFLLISALVMAYLIILSAKSVPIASNFLQGALHRYSLYAKSRLQPEQRIIVYKVNMPSILFYSDRKIINTGSVADMETALQSEGKPFLAITKTKQIEHLIPMGFEVIESDKKYALLEKK